MNNIHNHLAKKKISRRSVLAHGAAAAVAITAIPSKVIASPLGLGASANSLSNRQSSEEQTSVKYLCENMHDKIAMQLDDMIADPDIDGEQTALALMEARCPGCGGRVHPKTSSLSAVVPKWKSPVALQNSGAII